MDKLQPNEYRCAACGGVFKKGWSDEEAREEAAKIFPGLDTHDEEQSCLVCDDCFRQMGLIE